MKRWQAPHPRGLLLSLAIGAFGCGSGVVSPRRQDVATPSTLGWPLRPTTARAPSDAARDAAMVCVAAGPFTRGYDVPPLNRDEYPKAKVDLPAFWIDRHEVTVAEFRSCVGRGACDGRFVGSTANSTRKPTPSADCNTGHRERAQHPINCVSWVDAYRYCASVGKRLPTEAEWEKAARGASDDRQAPWGALGDLGGERPRANLADRSAAKGRPAMKTFTGLDDGFVTTAPVGSFPDGASPYGALDMLGNVAEWVFDFYDADAYFASATGSPPAAGTLRVYRGHSWSSVPTVVRITRRSAAFAGDRDASTGFRCALDGAVCDDHRSKIHERDMEGTP